MEIIPNYILSNLTTFKIGGPADFFVSVISVEELKAALKLVREKSLEVFVLGNGSNVVISDEGFRGLIIHNQIKGLEIETEGVITIMAGENWDDVVAKSVANNLAGIECLSGVPGSAGGAVVQNIGAYGQTLGDVVTGVTACQTDSGESRVFSRTECEFEYRSSFFKNNPGKYILTAVKLQLKLNGEPTISYAHVKKHFENKAKPTLSAVRDFIIRLRASKGYLIMSGYDSYNTAGSFFKNPIVGYEQFEQLKPILGDASLNRFWETPKGVKIAAAYLTEQAGFAKGYVDGNVGISPKHSLSIINLGKATATEVKKFADKIKKVVLAKFHVQLEEEILYIGKF